jgi:hypothetical protein
MLTSLIYAALVELSAWEAGTSERGLRIARHALSEWYRWADAGSARGSSPARVRVAAAHQRFGGGG